MSSWSDQIEEDLDWRFAELAAIKVECLKLPKGSPKRAALLRALWVMLYAHYEGFSKSSWDLLLDAIEKARCARGNLIAALACESLRKRITFLKSKATHREVFDFCKTGFDTALQERASFDTRYKPISNLPPDNYCLICAQFGLPCEVARQHRAKMERLVYFRHEIAHGQKLFHDTLEQYKEYEDAASAVMIELGLGVVEMLNSGAYMNAPGSP